MPANQQQGRRMAQEKQDDTSPGFPPTHWTLVARAREEQTALGLAALDELLRAYGPVLQRYLVHIMRLRPEQAQDLVQEFVARRVLEKRLMDRADRSRGRFRSFLLKSFLNFVNSERRKERAAKRGPPASQRVDLDEHAGEIADPRQGRKAFDALWARQALGAALDRMRQECADKKRMDLWIIFEQRILNPIFSDDPPRAYEDIVADLGLQSPLQASNLLITAKRTFRRSLEAVVRKTVADEEEMTAEIAALKRALANAHPAASA